MAAPKADFLREPAPVERREAHGRGEEKARHVRHLREQLQVLIEDARARGMDFSFEHSSAWWAVRQTG